MRRKSDTAIIYEIILEDIEGYIIEHIATNEFPPDILILGDRIFDRYLHIRNNFFYAER